MFEPTCPHYPERCEMCEPDGRDPGCYLFADDIDRHSAAYLFGADEGYGCARGLSVPPAEVVAAWGQAYAENEGYHPDVQDTVRLWFIAGFAQGCQEWHEAERKAK